MHSTSLYEMALYCMVLNGTLLYGIPLYGTLRNGTGTERYSTVIALQNGMVLYLTRSYWTALHYTSFPFLYLEMEEA